MTSNDKRRTLDQIRKVKNWVKYLKQLKEQPVDEKLLREVSRVYHGLDLELLTIALEKYFSSVQSEKVDNQ